MSIKPNKRDIKVWMMADSHTGYFSKFLVYTGKGDSPERGLGPHVIKSLTEPLKQKFHHVYFDNFFTSEQLLVDLERLDLCLWDRRKGSPRVSSRTETSEVQREVVYIYTVFAQIKRNI